MKDITITICIGSSCHLKGSKQVIQKLETLIKEANVADRILLNGSFCIGDCVKGVCVKLNDEVFSVKPETTEEFFQKEVMGRLAECL